MELSVQGFSPDASDGARDNTIFRKGEQAAFGTINGLYAKTTVLSVPVIQPVVATRGSAKESSNLGTLTALQLGDLAKWQVQVERAEAERTVNSQQVPLTSGSQCRTDGYSTVAHDYPLIPVGELHLYDDISGYLKYGKTADSDLGVGIKIGSGPWEVRDSIHVGQSTGTTYTANRSAPFGRWMVTKFHYVHEHRWVECGYYGRYDHWEDRIRAISWVGGIYDGRDVSYLDGPDNFYHVKYETSCGEGCIVPLGPGDEQLKSEESRGAKYSSGVLAFGITLTAQSGYSTSVQMYHRAGNHNYPHYMFCHCGPPSTSRNVYNY